MSCGERAPAGPASARLVLALCLGLVLVVGALYAQTFWHEFVSFDDGAYLTENPHVAGGLTFENVRWAFTRFHSANWHPLTWLSHQLDVELFGLEPGLHHLVNVALHALNAVLCFVFLRRATASTWPSVLVALLFAVHPQRVESVAWASERKDVLSGLFFFLTLLAYERYARAPSLARYGLVALGFVLGLLSKPMLVTLPLVLLLLDVWPLERAVFMRPWLPYPAPTHPGEARRGRFAYGAFLERLPLFLLAAGSALVTLVAQRAGGAVQPMEALSLPVRLATAVLGMVTYLGQALWPRGLCFFYPHPALVEGGEFEPLGWRVWLAAGLLAAVSLGAWWSRARFPFLLVGWAWFLVMLLPVVGIVQVGSQFSADRYAYLPLLGPTFALVFMGAFLGAFLGRGLLGASGMARAGFGLGLGIAALLAMVAYRQIGTWRDSGTLATRALAVTSGNYVAHEHLGLWLQHRGELEAAREHYLAALTSAPRLPSSHVDLGAVYAQLGQREEAELSFREALRLVPDHLDARMSLGLLLQREGDLEGALLHYEIATREHADEPRVWLQLAEVQFVLARHPAARAAFQRARAGALAELQLGISLSPVTEERQAWVLATSPEPGERDPARALALLEGCAARHPSGSWTHARVLAAAQAAAGRSEEAVRSAAEASALAPSTEWPQLKAERELYAAGRALGR